MKTKRVEKIKEIIKNQGLDALFISNQENVTYLTNFSGLSPNEREGFLVVTQTRIYLLTFPTYFCMYKSCDDDIKTLNITSTNRLADHLSRICKKEQIKSIGFEEENLTISELSSLKKKVSTRWKRTKKIVEELRIIKDEEELICIKQAIQATDRAFDFIKKEIKKGKSEKDLSLALEFFIKKNAQDTAFPPIVAFDKNASIPHYLSSEREKLTKNNLILMDFGAKIGNYCADMTRVIFFGSPDNTEAKVYNTVLKSQEKALKEIRPQITGAQADKTARDYISSHGFSPYLHGLGHGVGLSIHESPRLKIGSREILEENMVFSVEPGIYLEGEFGVRIEDLVILKKTGVEILSKSPKDIAIL